MDASCEEAAEEEAEMIDVKFSNFFDRPAITSKLDDAARKTLSKFGSYVRTRARRSIRTRKKKSATPGNPPFDHGGYLRRWIFFQYEPENYGVVIGPKLFGSGKPPKGSDKTVPQLLEEGGKVTHWRTKKPATYRRFPFMKPALKAELPQFAGMFANSIK